MVTGSSLLFAVQPGCNENFQVWTHENHAVEIDPYLSEMGKQNDYVLKNPVRGRLGAITMCGILGLQHWC